MKLSELHKVSDPSTVSVEASSTIYENKAVRLDDNGKVSSIAKADISSLNVLAVDLSLGIKSNLSCIHMFAENKFLVAYADMDNSYSLYIKLYRIEGNNTIYLLSTTGPIVPNVSALTITMLEPYRFCLGFCDGKIKILTFEIEGNNVIYNLAAEAANHTTSYMSICRINNTRVIVADVDTNTNQMYCGICDISGLTTTYRARTLVGSNLGNSHYVSICKCAEDKFIASYTSNNTVTVRAILINGGMVLGTEVTLSSNTSSPSVTYLEDHKAVIAHRSGYGGVMEILTVVGTTITVHSTVSSNMNETYPYIFSLNKEEFLYVGKAPGSVKVGVELVNGNSITNSTRLNGGTSDANLNPTMSMLDVGNYGVALYYNSSNYNGLVSLFNLSTTLTPQWLGMATHDANVGDIVKVKCLGVTEGLEGLNPNKKCYINSNGGISHIESSVEAGIAVTSDTIILKES